MWLKCKQVIQGIQYVCVIKGANQSKLCVNSIALLFSIKVVSAMIIWRKQPNIAQQTLTKRLWSFKSVDALPPVCTHPNILFNACFDANENRLTTKLDLHIYHGILSKVDGIVHGIKQNLLLHVHQLHGSIRLPSHADISHVALLLQYTYGIQIEFKGYEKG